VATSSSPKEPRALTERALRIIEKRDRVRDLIAVDQGEITLPSTGARAYRVVAVRADDANGAQYLAVVNEEGDEIELSEEDRERLVGPPEVPPVSLPTSPLLAAAITIDPTENTLVLKPGDSHSEVITVKVPRRAGVTKADVYFLADTTGSMGSFISAVQTGATSILTALSALGVDLAFGVGQYRDFPNDAFAFQHLLAPTNAAPAVTAAIGTWSAAGGGDTPEGQLYALHKIAEPPGGAIGWRSGAKRIVVWFGDAPGHDPVCKAISGEPADITEATVTASLVAQAISVLAISTRTPGLDDDPTIGTNYVAACGAPGGVPGQGTRIAAATGGVFVPSIDPTTIVTKIIDLVSAAVGGITNLKLVPTGGTAPFVASISPAAGYGPLSGDEDHVLPFDVVFKGVVPCTDEDQVFTGTIAVVADGATVAEKRVKITVPACPPKFTYVVKFVCGTQPDCQCDCVSVRPGTYATEINIYNFQRTEVEVEKKIVPVVFAGAPVGREPRAAGPRAVDRIKLPAFSATMDDCCRLTELLLGAPGSSPAPLTIGFLQITSDQELSVTAVYTASDLGGTSISLDIEQIQPRRVAEKGLGR
jgi:hypothetical protein